MLDKLDILQMLGLENQNDFDNKKMFRENVLILSWLGEEWAAVVAALI